MMRQPSTQRSAGPVQAHALQLEQTRHLYAGLPVSIAISTVLALILAAVEWSVAGPPRLAGWLVMIGAVMLGRAVLAAAWRRGGQAATQAVGQWLFRFRVGVIGAGVSWGAGSMLLFPEGVATHQVFMAFVMAGLSAGAIPLLAVDRVSTLGFLVPTLVPLIVRFAVEGGSIPLAMGTMMVLFLVFLVASARSMRHSLHENFQRRVEAVEREQALLRSDERMNQAQQLAHLGSFDWNPVSGELAWSHEHFRLWGLEPDAIVPSYEIFKQGIHPDDVAQVEVALQHALKGGRFYDCVHRVRWSDGRERHIHGRGEVLFDGEGRAVRMIGTVQDITERVHAEKTLIAAKEEAELASRAKSLFLASMSHELRTPLNAILGYAQLMEITPGLSVDMLGNAQEIKRAGNLLLTLVNDLLDLSKAEAGRLEMHLENFDLAQTLAQCHAQYSGQAQEQHITLLHDSSCQAVQVTADRQRLMQVLNNLVSNAIKYNRPGGSVTVSCTTVVPGRIRIAVTDTGPGIPPARQAQLFQPFNRLGVEMGKVEGSGIGLVITRRLVEAMNGSIGVQSTPGSGSTFWVELPMAGAAATGSRSTLRAVPAGSAAGVMRVLVAEDYVPNQNVLRLQLRTLGCEADVVSDGAQALEKWRTDHYDLILTDLNMPVMDGLELTRVVRQQEREDGGHVPIVAITAAAVRSELKRCRDAGMDDVLTKPVALEDLRHVLERWQGGGGETPVPVRADATVAVTQDEDKILDLGQLYRILGQSSAGHARDLVNTFLHSATEGLNSLAGQPENSLAVASEMHKQKSPARIVGAQRYARLAEALEQAAKSGAMTHAAVALAELREALSEVRAEAMRQQVGDREGGVLLPKDPARPAVHCRSVLVVDDDPVVLMQMTSMLSSLGVAEVLTAGNGLEALQVIDERADELEVLVCDLSMPEMDGVELIRRFGQTGFKGGLILMSGADLQVLSTVNKLAGLQGLRVLGQVQKPVSPDEMAALLSRAGEIPAQKRQSWIAPEVSPRTMREGMARDEFSVWLQPKVNTLSLKPTGVEVLARWRRPDGSFVPTEIFIRVAEREGLIGELSQILVSRGLRDGARLHKAGFPLKIAINLSGLWLNDLGLPDFVLDTAKAVGLQARDIILEVTETGVMEDLTTALDVLTRLRLKGFGLSIDDFGIGYSSFEQLGRIPFTEMKLDRAFVCRGTQDAAARAILEGSMGMAKKLGLSTVAEGVETEVDLELVRTLGCDNVQGYLIAQPMPVDDLITWLSGAQLA